MNERVFKRSQRRMPAATMLAALFLAVLASGCSGAKPENPLVDLRERLHSESDYSVILADMRSDRGLFSSIYFHRYQIVVGEKMETTSWTQVSKEMYRRYESLLGMTILSKSPEGEVTEAAHPPGYQYVGNSRYGSWQRDRSGGSFWVFYGQYALMRDLFGLGSRRVYRNDWDDYRSYRQQRRPYFGPKQEYGTNGSHTKKANPSFFERKKATQTRSKEKFGNKVSRRVGRTKTSSRSRGGGFGK